MTVRKTNRPKTQSQTAKIQTEKIFTYKAGKKGGEKQPPKADYKTNCIEPMTVRKTKPTTNKIANR